MDSFQDGDYNKPIPAQYVESLNHPVTPLRSTATAHSADSLYALCDACNANQLLKVKQLANFVPYNEVEAVLTSVLNEGKVVRIQQYFIRNKSKNKQLIHFLQLNYDMEVEEYRQHLEQVYKLCHPCHLKVSRVISGLHCVVTSL